MAVIKYKGFQVAPAELEDLLTKRPEVSDAGVIPIYSEEQATELPRAFRTSFTPARSTIALTLVRGTVVVAKEEHRTEAKAKEISK